MARERTLRGREKLALIRDLADGGATQEELAEKYDMSQPGISTFAKRNADAIQEVRDNMEDEFAGLWVHKKPARLAEYQAGIERLAELVEDVDAEKTPSFYRGIAGMLRNVAEELGHLSPKDASEATRVDIRILGVDGDQL